MNIGIIIQARLGSTRLPRKILKEFYGGKTLLETVISNLKKVTGYDTYLSLVILSFCG